MMKIYVDIFFIINLIYDFLILNLVNIVLRRFIKVKRILFASLIGTVSAFSIFVPIFNNLFITIILSMIMVLVAFGFKDVVYFKNNLLYFYMISIIFGGFIYLINIKFNHFFTPQDIYNRRVLINLLGILFFGPLIYFLYIYTYKNNLYYHQNYYNLKFSLTDKIYDVEAFYDTGNLIKDPYKGRAVILISKKVLNGDIKNKSPIYVPCNMLNSKKLIECFRPNLLVINNKVIDNCLIGLFDDNFFYDNIKGIISGYIGDKIR